MGEKLEAVRKFFKRANDNPVGVYKGLTVIIQQTCPGCYVYLRGALDSFKNTGIDVEKMVAEKGECVFIAGGVPDFDPLYAEGKNLFVLGDCWKYFPSKEKGRSHEAREKVFTYPGLRSVYVSPKLILIFKLC